MTTRNPNPAHTPTPGVGPERTGQPSLPRRLAAAGWGNRPTWGAWAALLAVPGTVQVAFTWPWWWAAGIQWPLYAALWAVLTLIDATTTDPRTGHQLPAAQSAPAAAGLPAAKEDDQ